MPRDAASLVLYRGADPEILIGRRSASARFMPGRYVFPGGRLEPADIAAGRHLSGLMPAGMLADLRRSANWEVACGLPCAALRETAEETGWLLADGAGLAVPVARVLAAGADADGFWAACADDGIAPGFAGFSYLARALTPVGLPLRYNTRFFLAAWDGAVDLALSDTELEDLHWRPIETAGDLPMADVTRFMLDQALLRLTRSDIPGGRVPFFTYGPDGPRIVRE